MSDFFIDTSYLRKYRVIEASSDYVILKPLDDDTIKSYWREFVSGYITEPLPPDFIPTLRITQIPQDVLIVDAYVDYSIEYPKVDVLYDGKAIDVSSRISVNHPSSETPGLYALDFVISIVGQKPERIWRSWLSIEEAPILRNIITPWNRENKTIANLNRLIIEPQFMEAMYEAGVPLYNFQQSNANTAISQFAAQQYKSARAFVKNGNLFISGPRLPLGTVVNIGGTDICLRNTVISVSFTKTEHYSKGSIVSYNGSDYYALDDIPYKLKVSNKDTDYGSVLPTVAFNSVSDAPWIRGYCYIVDNLTMTDGEYSIKSIWSVVDVNGYLFKMDLIRALYIRNYWGHYNSKHFYDYAPGDLVSIVNNNIVSFYQRNDVSLDNSSLEESYKPGHYKNPHWVEVYSESNNTQILNPIIKPYTNASNSIVSKTYSAREDAFRMYANLVGIPTELISCIGSKYSVLLWALLYRTRETFQGLKTALNAIGIDVKDLHRAYPSIIYKNGDGIEISNVYEEIGILKDIAKSVESDRVWPYGIESKPDITDKDILSEPWITYSKDGTTVYSYSIEKSEWYEIYRFSLIGSDNDNPNYSVNNRYYKAELNLLNRLSKEGSLYLDGVQWIDHNYFTGISGPLTKLLDYEIPIYIYFRIRTHVVTIGHTNMAGISGGVIMQDAWGGTIGLNVYPSKVFNAATCKVDAIWPEVLYSYDYPGIDSPDDDWTNADSSFKQGPNYRHYSFDSNAYIRLTLPDDSKNLYKTRGVWTSRYTIGCIGDPQSKGTDDFTESGDGFLDAKDFDLEYYSRSPDMYLCKGNVGCSLRIEPDGIPIQVCYKQWNYVFDSIDWKMDESLAFTGWGELTDVSAWGTWNGDFTSFKNTIVSCATPGGSLTYNWDISEPVLYIRGRMPKLIYMYDALGRIRCCITIPYNPRMILEDNNYILKIKFL